tara:strand:+ start:44 stop:274 length:231 start_codon:yes stop_codon:yes gene_type:complete
MKSSKTDVLEKKVNALIGVVKQILDENAYLKDLSVGTLETIKLMNSYEEAIEKLKEKLAKESGEDEEVNTSGKTFE